MGSGARLNLLSFSRQITDGQNDVGTLHWSFQNDRKMIALVKAESWNKLG
jgi:hypothetical protein